MNELHKQVLTLLTFDAKSRTEEVHSKSNPQEKYYPTRWTLTRNGKTITRDYNLEDTAWEQAPTLEVLMLPLLDAIRQVFEVSITPRKDDYQGSISTSYVYYAAEEQSLPLTVADLFIAGCRLGLIDPSKVVLS